MKKLILIGLLFIIGCHDSTISTAVQPTVIYTITVMDKSYLSKYGYNGYCTRGTFDGTGEFVDSTGKFQIGDTIKVVKK